ncbi:hypothetical protein FOZ60_008026 [Perkinsus olseni]|uniref:Sphingomyelin synthase-like domain-containing protein n=1 Tax=Perkinsus olseni TaxID=32597 RepID=A0A7J6PEU3_PEROL|nr:hypothetical protein FOZ60_008026 [Perkinsus olseni]
MVQAALANWKVLKITCPWFVVHAFIFAAQAWSVELVYFLEGKYGVYGGPSYALVDFGHQLIPEIPIYPLGGISMWLLISAILWAFSWALIISIVRPRDGVTFIGIIWRALSVTCMAYILRAVSFLVTLLPAPWPPCQRFPRPGLEAYFDPPVHAQQIFSMASSMGACGDNMFSGHTTSTLVAALVATHYIQRWFIVLPSWTFVVAEIVVLVAERAHYTVDIWVAMFTIPMLWICFFHFFPRDPTRNVRFWRDQAKPTHLDG